MQEFSWYITDEEKKDISEIVKKNRFLSEGPGKGNMFKTIDISKLFDTEDFQKYITKNLLFEEEDYVSMIKQIWWYKLLCERDEEFTYEEHIENEKHIRKKSGIRWPVYSYEDEFLAKFPEIIKKWDEHERKI